MGGILFDIMGFLALFFIGVLLRAGKVMHPASVRTFEFGIRNDTLNMELKEEVATREQLNAQLQQEVTDRTLSEEKLSKRNQDLIRLNEELTSTKLNLESSNKKLEIALMPNSVMVFVRTVQRNCSRRWMMNPNRQQRDGNEQN